MSVHFNEDNGLKDLKECVVNINGEIKNVSSIYENMENTNLKASRIWGTNKGYNFNSVLTGSSGNRKYFSGDNFNDLQDIIINWNGNPTSGLSDFVEKIGSFILTNASSSILKSYDGITFNEIYKIGYGYNISMAHGVNTIVIKCTTGMNSGSTYIYCSKDEGVTWTPILLTSAFMKGNVIYGNGKFICYSMANETYYYSDNGIDWLLGNIPYSNGHAHSKFTIWGIMFMNGKFIGHGTIFNGVSVYTNRRCFSDDGINWTISDINGGFGDSAQCIGYVNGKYYVYVTGKSFIYSTDSITWEFGEMNIDPSPTHAVITYSKKQNKFFLISNKYEVFYSYDMTNWEYIITLPRYFDHKSKIYMD